MGVVSFEAIVRKSHGKLLISMQNALKFIGIVELAEIEETKI